MTIRASLAAVLLAVLVNEAFAQSTLTTATKQSLGVKVERQEATVAELLATRAALKYRVKLQVAPAWRSLVVANTDGEVLAVRLSTLSDAHHWELEARSSTLEPPAMDLLEARTISTLPKPSRWDYSEGVSPFTADRKRGTPLLFDGPLGQLPPTTQARFPSSVCGIFDWSVQRCRYNSQCYHCGQALVGFCRCVSQLPDGLTSDEIGAACRESLDLATASCSGWVKRQTPFLELQEKDPKKPVHK